MLARAAERVAQLLGGLGRLPGVQPQQFQPFPGELVLPELKARWAPHPPPEDQHLLCFIRIRISRLRRPHSCNKIIEIGIIKLALIFVL